MRWLFRIGKNAITLKWPFGMVVKVPSSDFISGLSDSPEDFSICYSLLRLRQNMVVKTVILNTLCTILNCRIEDIMEYVPDE